MLNKIFRKQATFFITAVFAFVAFFSAAVVLSQVLAAQPVNAAIGDSCTDDAGCDDGQACINEKCAADVWGEKSGAGKATIQGQTGLGDRDPRTIAANVVNVVLGFLGIIAVLLILVGGFRWMTAQGNDEAIAGAKNLMIAGVVGLIIILAAFGIARFVIDALVDATTTT